VVKWLYFNKYGYEMNTKLVKILCLVACYKYSINSHFCHYEVFLPQKKRKDAKYVFSLLLLEYGMAGDVMGNRHTGRLLNLHHLG
jgi:hypothetical protein